MSAFEPATGNSTTPVRPRMRKAERKKQLLSHAKQLFITLGYQDTTTEKIARAAGSLEPVLYRTSDSKNAVFGGVARDLEKRL